MRGTARAVTFTGGHIGVNRLPSMAAVVAAAGRTRLVAATTALQGGAGFQARVDLIQRSSELCPGGPA